MSEDLKDKIQKASWKVDDLLDQVKDNLLPKAQRISPQKRLKLPKFSGLWRERSLKNYIERLQESVERPRMARSKQLLDEISISSEELSKENLEDVERIEEVHRSFKELNKELGEDANILIGRKILLKWLKEGTSEAIGKLQSIVEAMNGYKRLKKLESLGPQLRNRLFEEAFENSDFIGKAEELDIQIAYLTGYGITIEYGNGDINELLQDCEIIYNAFKEFEDSYKISSDEVGTWVKGKSLAEIRKYLEGGKDPFSTGYTKLKRKWRELVSILGEESQEPEGFSDLKREIKELEERFKKSLGEQGLRLLSFFRGESEFPKELLKEDLVVLLKKLQPFITIGFKEEDNG